MAETKWTPGPWTEDCDGDETWLRGADDRIVCDFLPAYHADTGPDETAKANLALVAAAPDLYEALRDMVLNGESHKDCPRTLPSLPLAKARAALARARGE